MVDVPGDGGDADRADDPDPDAEHQDHDCGGDHG
jgi:hypothetical protein